MNNWDKIKNQFDIDCSQNKTRPVYAKRYNKDGEEYLEIIDEIDIEEDLKEKSLEINRIKEIYNIQERIKAEELLDELTDEEYLKEIQEASKIEEIDTYEFLNKTEQMKELYNKMPEEVKIKYKNISKFTKEYVPEFIKNQYEKLSNTKQEQQIEQKQEQQLEQQQEINKTLQQKIKELQEKIEKGANENV